jgi:hypothetical protein
MPCVRRAVLFCFLARQKRKDGKVDFWPSNLQLNEIGKASLELADAIDRGVETTPANPKSSKSVFSTNQESFFKVYQPLMDLNAVLHGRSLTFHRQQVESCRKAGYPLDIQSLLVSLPGDLERDNLYAAMEGSPNPPVVWFATDTWGWPMHSQEYQSLVEVSRLCLLFFRFFEVGPYFATNLWTQYDGQKEPWPFTHEFFDSQFHPNWVRCVENGTPVQIKEIGTVNAHNLMPLEWLDSLRWNGANLAQLNAVPSDDLIARLLNGPNDVELTPRELAFLEAYLKQPIPVLEIQRERKSHPNNESESCNRRSKLKLIRNFNRNLQKVNSTTEGVLFAGPSGAIQTPTVSDAVRKPDTVGCLQTRTEQNAIDELRDAIQLLIGDISDGKTSLFEAVSRVHGAARKAFRADLLSNDDAKAILAVVDDTEEIWLKKNSDSISSLVGKLKAWSRNLIIDNASRSFEKSIKPADATATVPDASGKQDTVGCLPRAQQLAYLAAEYAESENHRQMTDREAYDWLKENGSKGDEFNDYKLPLPGTFADYLTKARRALGEQRKQPRGGRTGRTVKRQSEI